MFLKCLNKGYLCSHMKQRWSSFFCMTLPEFAYTFFMKIQTWKSPWSKIRVFPIHTFQKSSQLSGVNVALSSTNNVGIWWSLVKLYPVAIQYISQNLTYFMPTQNMYSIAVLQITMLIPFCRDSFWHTGEKVIHTLSSLYLYQTRYNINICQESQTSCHRKWRRANIGHFITLLNLFAILHQK